MKRLVTMALLGIFPLLLGATENQGPEKITLNKGWEFSQDSDRLWRPF